jgi:PqqD family protein of HPr-rel-A system
MLSESSVLVRSGGPSTTDVEEETLMFDPGQGKYFALQGVGGRIWELLEEPRSVAELCETVSSEFEVDAATCRSDVVPFLDNLREAGLVEVKA